jgi:hypothetical protein
LLEAVAAFTLFSTVEGREEDYSSRPNRDSIDRNGGTNAIPNDFGHEIIILSESQQCNSFEDMQS